MSRPSRASGSHRLRPLALMFALSLAGGAAGVQADDGIPGLLKYAQQYQEEAPVPPAANARTHDSPPLSTPQHRPETTHRPAGGQATTHKPGREKTVSQSHTAAASTQVSPPVSSPDDQLATLRQQLAARQDELSALRAQLAEAQRQIKSAVPKTVPPPDPDALRQWLNRWHDAVTGTPSAPQLRDLTRQARQQAKQAQQTLVDTQAQLQAMTRARDTLQQQLTHTTQALAIQETAAQAANEKLTQQRAQQAATLSDLQQQRDEIQARLTTQTRAAERTQTLVTALRAQLNAPVDATPGTLATPAQQQAYAAGTALGHDIVRLLDQHQSDGLALDRTAVRTGVDDAFSGRYKLDASTLQRALADSQQAATHAQQTAGTARTTADAAYVAEFARQKGVIRSPTGFWYRVDYPGDAPLPGEAMLDVVVKEALTDGTVTQDMDLNGTVLTQHRAAFPPLFQEVLGLLRNHGELTMVVPPALAYGEAGDPPKVPANATMIYTLRVEEHPRPVAKTGSPQDGGAKKAPKREKTTTSRTGKSP
ncbi:MULTISPECIES: FKBP-type peptidyl-prolyl cis-trans isomerase N-terminal domain-containing protein [Serratia]|uniref:FKBP-type peptidyl-prolyl cis-trans isomerase N-terminal domain-containing protein n=1 Tax=Serratia TaxID=613 RepID=UPI002361EF03|nr:MULTISPECIES: FKBP-type peptidyl-prolyl cis-trans isomerase N-terminal domain-containing protein [Serratia]